MSAPMKKTIVATVAAATVAGGLAIGSVGNAAPGPQTITARLKLSSVTFVHHKRSTKGSKLAPGDRVVTRQKAYSADGKRTGTLATDCVNTGRTAQVFKAALMCTTTYTFANGQIVAVGVAKLSANPSIPIVGGTGAYRGARGVTKAGSPVKGYDSVDLLELDN